MELLAQVGEALAGVHHGHLGGVEGVARLQLPPEVEGMDPHDQTGLIKLCARDLDEMVARVHQGRTPAGAVVLVGVRITHHHKGVALVAGGTPHTAHAVGALGQVGPHRLPLPGVGAAQGDVVPLSRREVQTQGHHTGQGHGGFSPVVHPHRPGDQV